MDEESSYITTELRKLEKYVRTLPIMRKASMFGREERDKLHALQDILSEAKRLAHDAVTSDDSLVRRESFRYCEEQLTGFQTALLTASHTNLVDGADVAQLSAMADQIGDIVRKRSKL